MTMSLSLKIVTPFLAWSGKDGILFSVQSPSAGRLAPTCTTQLASLLQDTLDLLEFHAASISTTGNIGQLAVSNASLAVSPTWSDFELAEAALCLFALQFLFL